VVTRFDDGQPDFVMVIFLHFALELTARAIYYRNPLPRADAHDVQGMVCLTPGQKQVRLLALVRRQIKAMHE
jgi:hypothetical protein